MSSAYAALGVERLALLLALSLFFGFAFEQFYADRPRRPGGVRTFPLLALAGAALYLLEPRYGAAFVGGLLVLGGWIYAYIERRSSDENPPESNLVVPVCNLLAYSLGPLALTQPFWLCIAVTVAAVLLLGGRRPLHEWVQRVPKQDILTAAQFLILVGVVLPVLAGEPPIPYTSITPFGVWLAVVAVSSISYASYLLQQFVFPGGGTLLMSVLGGLYSSTATTVVLARRARDAGMTPEIEAGIVAATAMMYLRILAICALFSLSLGRVLALPLLGLAAASALLAAFRLRAASAPTQSPALSNPLQIPTALIFALAFVAISAIATLAERHWGAAGIYALAGIVGVTDIDPFVLSLAQGGAAGVGLTTAASAIVIAASSNDVLKAIYSLAFAGRSGAKIPALMLVALAALGVAIAVFLIR